MKYKYLNIDDIGKTELNLFYKSLNSNHKSDIDKILNPYRRKQSIIGKLLLSILLKEEYNIDLNNIEIVKNKNGKPYIKDKSIYFNISHSYNYVICIVSLNEVGIDIEKIRKINKNVLKYFNINNVSHKDFFIIYTKLESYIKMIGENILNVDLKRIKPNGKFTTIDDINGFIGHICFKN